MSSPLLPQSITRLIEEFCRLPGIGPKSAERLTFHLLRCDDRKHHDLGEALLQLKQELVYCEECFNINTETPCALCQDPSRDRNLLCIVEEPLDMVAIEKTRSYKGLYHILHGAISPIDGLGPQQLRIAELINRLQKPDSKISEVILATNLSLEGEATAQYIYNEIHNLPLTITRIAKGLPVGGNLEYADNDTLKNALKGRKEF